MPVDEPKKLYHIYFMSDACRDRMLGPNLDGVVYLSDQEKDQLHERGNQILANDGGEFELTHISRPYTMDDILAELPVLEEEDDAQT